MTAIKISKKICMLGTFGVGKTSLVRRFVHGLFADEYKSTIGVQIFQKSVSLNLPAKNINLVLWDLANIEQMTPAIENYFRGAAAALVVFDVTRPATFNTRTIHLEAFLQINPNATLLMAANKIDLLESSQNMPEPLARLATQYQCYLLPTSAKNGTGVEDMFHTLATTLGAAR